MSGAALPDGRIEHADVEHATDVGMRNPKRDPHLGQESLETTGVALDVGRETLQRDRCPSFRSSAR